MTAPTRLTAPPSAEDAAAAFLAAVLPVRGEDEAYRCEIFPAPAGAAGKFKNFLNAEALARHLVAHGQTANAYFACATFPADGEDRLAEHALRVGALWADLDCGPGKPYETREAARSAIDAFVLPPSALVNSGNGLQAWWLLDEPSSDLDRAVRLVRGLAHSLDGDSHVADRARIMRVPGTLNVKPSNPQPLPVELLHLDVRLRYGLDDFVAAGVDEIGAAAPGSASPGASTVPSGLPVGSVRCTSSRSAHRSASNVRRPRRGAQSARRRDIDSASLRPRLAGPGRVPGDRGRPVDP